MTGKLYILLVLLAAALTGCEALAYGLYLIAPVQTKEKEAEFADLPGHSLAVVVFADPGVLYEHPRVQLDLSSMVAAEIQKNLKDVKIIEPRRVVKYQHENIHWDEMPRTNLGKVFEAQYLLQITLVGYATSEPGSMNLYRGRITADADLYDTSREESKARVWQGKDLRVVHPESGVGRLEENDRKIREETDRIFAEMLAKRFYKHKIPEEE